MSRFMYWTEHQDKRTAIVRGTMDGNDLRIIRLTLTGSRYPMSIATSVTEVYSVDNLQQRIEVLSTNGHVCRFLNFS